MTDNEIMKALECCSTNNQNCYDCPLHLDCMMGVPSKNISRAALDLIQRQQEQIKALIAGQETLQKHFTEEKDRIVEQLEKVAEGVKEKANTLPEFESAGFLCGWVALKEAIKIVKGVQNE